MKLSGDQIIKVATLAKLSITDSDITKYSDQLSKIIDYIDQLKQIDTSDVDPTYNVTGNTNVTREDTPGTSLTQDEAVQNAPDKSNGLFVTKGVFENE